MKTTRSYAPALTLVLLGLSGCGGGDSLSEAIQDATKSVSLDKYSDSCEGPIWKTVTRTTGDQSIVMSVTVNTSGDVEPLKAEWSVGDGQSIGSGLKSASASTDATGRKFTQTLVVASTGDLSYKLSVRDKNDDKRFETTCKVHVS